MHPPEKIMKDSHKEFNSKVIGKEQAPSRENPEDCPNKNQLESGRNGVGGSQRGSWRIRVKNLIEK